MLRTTVSAAIAALGIVLHPALALAQNDVVVLPNPSTLALLCAGIGAIWWLVRRDK